MPEGRLARDEPRVRVGLARAHALVGAARSYVYDVVGEIWATLTAGDQPSHCQRATLAGIYPHTTRTCHDAVEALGDIVGTASLLRSCPLERHRRDLITMRQHVTAQDRFLEVVGGLWLEGADIDHPLLNQRLF
jgi:indole-3-acetate monooxygenase